MDPSLQPLLDRLEHLSGQFHELRDGVQEAIQIADISPEMAVARARKVLEYVIRDVYERRISEPPGTRPLENLLQRLVKDGHFPDRLDAYANTIRKLGNVGVHSFAERVEIADVYQALAQLMPILEWYFAIERPEALDGKARRPPQPVRTETKSKEPTAVPSHTAVIPKGLRSFDAHDADFFLELLPGPRNRDDLPESIQFWKTRIEERDCDLTFSVGLIYGPSGCGKSSLVKAGLLPRLPADVLVVYVEATGDETESRLLKGLRKHCPGLPADLGPKETLSSLRRAQSIPAGKKLLIVLDQFEQWLHAKRKEQDTELVQALRQCDGGQVQCIVMVRDDFWMAATRFMRELELRLLEGQNSLAVDLFEMDHARKVLEAFGRAFGKLPANPDEASKEQKQFLAQAVSELANEGKVICVRLALFAEMMKGKPWTPTALQEVGGTEGVGVAFLEESFSDTNARPKYRLHQKAILSVLKALLPDAWTNIKGHMRSYQELLDASGYVDRPGQFEELLQILDTERRLITPTDPEGLNADHERPQELDARQRFYQLTHDYLVPSIREWLIRKQRESRQGRAELRLAIWSSVWGNKPENRNLPSWWEWVSIRLLTKKDTWTPLQQEMMRRAGRVHCSRSGIMAAVLLVASISGVSIRNAVVEKQNATRAEGIVDGLLNADIAQVPILVNSLEGYRIWADPLLKQEDAEAKEGSRQKLHMALALLPVDESKVNYVRDQLFVVTPTQFPVVCDALLSHKAAIVEPLWSVALDSKRETQQRFQAACALAKYDPEGQRWARVQNQTADVLVAVPAVYLATWMDALHPVRARLLAPLSVVFRDANRQESERFLATEILSDYAADNSQVLSELVMSADEKQFAVIYKKLAARGDEGLPYLREEIKKPLPYTPDTTDEARDALAQRQANAAVALLKMNRPGEVWPLLKHSSDPRVRTYLIHRFAPLGADASVLVRRLDVELDPSGQRALILCLGEFDEALFPQADRQPLIAKLLNTYRNNPDPGIHGAAEWLLRQKGWDQAAALSEIDRDLQVDNIQLQAQKATEKRQWYVNTEGQTFVILNAEKPFVMGSPLGESGRQPIEVQHQQRIGRVFAIATKIVTKAQFRHFLRDNPDVGQILDIDFFSPTDDCPQSYADWYDAARYCNWLSKNEGIPREQWCYEPNSQGKFADGMKPAADYLQRVGYRLPTEAEWEYACRCGSQTMRYYGASVTLLPKYAWFNDNSRNLAHPVGMKKPNDYGLFDMLGDTWQWCDNSYQDYPVVVDGLVAEDTGTMTPVGDKTPRLLRGGSFNDIQLLVRCAYRDNHAPTFQCPEYGIRPVRTLPPSSSCPFTK